MARTPMFNMSFHCENDTSKLTSLLKQGLDIKPATIGNLMVEYAKMLEGTPYKGGTLEVNDTEKLVINIDSVDCTTFVESVAALTRCTLNRRYSWRDYAHFLQEVRYRQGNLDGYASRLHYVSDWAIDNQHRGNLKEITSDIKGVRNTVRTLNFMSRNRSLYPKLADDEQFERIKSVEIGYRNHKFSYINSTGFSNKKFVEVARSGDIIAMVTKENSLDVQHMAILYIDQATNTPFIIHASSKYGKVVLDKEDLSEYLRHNRSVAGIRVFRVTE